MSSITSPTPTSYLATRTDLFPSSTRSAQPDRERRGANVYYLVFLGVLVVLLLLAACLALRAFRIRRRYRTATQLALARGGIPPHEPGTDFWGLGGFNGGWNETEVEPRRRHGKSRWQRIPVLYENDVEKEDAEFAGELGLGDNMPVTLLSTREHDPEPVPAPVPEFEPSRTSLAQLAFRRRQSPPPPSPLPVTVSRELEQPIEGGDGVRLAVIIQMPSQIQSEVADESFDDETTGWEPGMELGVWEGHTSNRSG